MTNTLLIEALPVAILCTAGNIFRFSFVRTIDQHNVVEPNVRTRTAALELLAQLADVARCNGDDNGNDECKQHRIPTHRQHY
jgi:hypothetical protein